MDLTAMPNDGVGLEEGKKPVKQRLKVEDRIRDQTFATIALADTGVVS